MVKNLKRPITPGEAFGSSVHNALKKWGELEMKHIEPLAPGQQMLFEGEAVTHAPLDLEQLLALWHGGFIVDAYPNRVEADFDRWRGERLLRHFYDWWQREPRLVVAIEKSFAVSLNGRRISGRLDRVERTAGGLHVIDFKTGGPRSQESVDADLQLSIYALATDQSLQSVCEKLTLLFLDEEGVTERETARNQGQLQDASKQIELISARIDSGDFHPEPSFEKCSRCPYRTVCDASAAR